MHSILRRVFGEFSMSQSFPELLAQVGPRVPLHRHSCSDLQCLPESDIPTFRAALRQVGKATYDYLRIIASHVEYLIVEPERPDRDCFFSVDW